jgi:hypothetical protein
LRHGRGTGEGGEGMGWDRGREGAGACVRWGVQLGRWVHAPLSNATVLAMRVCAANTRKDESGARRTREGPGQSAETAVRAPHD